MRPKLALLVAPLLLLACACGTDSVKPAQSAGSRLVTEEQARKVFDDVAARSQKLSADKFCNDVAYQVQACQGVQNEAKDFCLEPGAKPRVVRSAAVRDTEDSDGGRVLEVEGRTSGGQRYVSEFFVTGAEGKPRASVGVYWTGLGLADSPLGKNNTVLPKSECSSKQ